MNRACNQENREEERNIFNPPTIVNKSASRIECRCGVLYLCKWYQIVCGSLDKAVKKKCDKIRYKHCGRLESEMFMFNYKL